MNRNIIKNISCYLLLVLMMVVSSCSDDEETVFEQSPTERIEARNAELQTLLLAETNGYKVVYFPNNQKYGGFTFFMKFNADGTVEMTSDGDANTEVQSSRYEVRLGSTTELVFTTRNHIHKLSDSNLPGLIGSGYEGNSIFEYISKNDGKITFREPRHEAILVFEPAQQDDWNQVPDLLAMRQNLVPSETSFVFQQFIIINANGETNYNLNYDGLRYHANPRNQAEDGTVSELKFGIAFTTEGLIISPPVEIEGVTYENFIYDASKQSFIATVGDTMASIGFADRPAFITNDVLKIGNGLNTFSYRVSEPANPLTSLGFDAMIAEVDAALAGFGISFSRFDMVLEPDENGDVFIWINTSGFWSQFGFKSSIVDKKLLLDSMTPLNANANFLQTQLKPLLDFFTSSEGLFYETTGNYLNFSNRAGTFTSAQDPSLRVYSFWF
ncbi:DUF4302 domain-containing protein [Aquimarina hainanensis]|uniref:DUF4302 domain-containing protein n=1 Tax=Aquimarina hainanensis TaxID=1578017 RepID=A0ABW5N1X1_9FLAO